MSSENNRFAFGKNWTAFLSVVNEERISSAVEQLRSKFGELSGKSFLDIGSGSGLHSLAAVRLGASRVHSFDFDQDSVNCAAELKRRFASDADWTVEQGSALDEAYMRSLGQFDVVYSWGVLHHTGSMWKALELAAIPASDCLMVAIYNDQGRISRRWHSLKKRCNEGGFLTKRIAELIVWYAGWGRYYVRDFLTLRPHRTVKQWRDYHAQRGMSPWHDIVDWAGGYPFEVAKPEEIFNFFRQRGFVLEKMVTCGGGKGCNEFVLSRWTERQ